MSVLKTFSHAGDFRDKEPPVPIPNTAVKLVIAEDTSFVRNWENRTLPVPKNLPFGEIFYYLTMSWKLKYFLFILFALRTGQRTLPVPLDFCVFSSKIVANKYRRCV